MSLDNSYNFLRQFLEKYFLRKVLEVSKNTLKGFQEYFQEIYTGPYVLEACDRGRGRRVRGAGSTEGGAERALLPSAASNTRGSG